MATGIDDIEWLDEAVTRLTAENTTLRMELRTMAALMEFDVESGRLTLTPTREALLKRARQLVPNISVSDAPDDRLDDRTNADYPEGD